MPYDYAGGYVRFGHQSLPDVPAGEMKSSAIQLGRFISMMLGWGELDGTRLLDSATVAEMTTIQHPAGVGLAWHHSYVGGHEVWHHTGGWTGMSTWIGFCQAEKTGAVVLCNMTGAHGAILGAIAPALLDMAAGVEEPAQPRASGRSPAPALARPVLFLAETIDHGSWAGSRLLDITGREVLRLRPGANDVSHLASGVYFVAGHPTNGDRLPASSPTGKVIVTR
jgi:hypothetical protein